MHNNTFSTSYIQALTFKTRDQQKTKKDDFMHTLSDVARWHLNSHREAILD